MKITTEIFIEKARNEHKDKYDYSLAKYVNMKTPVLIICKEHGVFKQSPDNHVHGHGCPRCAGNIKMNTNIFIKKARQKHGNKYDYSKVVYKHNKSIVCITCPIHGDFYQTPDNHIRGQRCPKCVAEANGERCRMSTSDFVKKAQEKHGNFYDYSEAKYTNNHTAVKIKCPLHGFFEQLPLNHPRGEGCLKCGIEKNAESFASNTSAFVLKARRVHGNRYDYSLVNYIRSNRKVAIVCKTHGEFSVSPNNHLRGKGCPICQCPKGEEKISLFLDKNNIKYYRQHKIFNNNVLCVNKFLLVDFYIPECNIFIEYNGEQHYSCVDHFGGQEKFQKQQERDFALRQYCKEHKIVLVEIPYTEYKNIDNILSNIFKNKTI